MMEIILEGTIEEGGGSGPSEGRERPLFLGRLGTAGKGILGWRLSLGVFFLGDNQSPVVVGKMTKKNIMEY